MDQWLVVVVSLISLIIGIIFGKVIRKPKAKLTAMETDEKISFHFHFLEDPEKLMKHKYIIVKLERDKNTFYNEI